ncbi:MAG TPA: PRC-barrel domain-containing protein [Stellaceae bacterium]|nr:PRC-barrel domain-containing protein [Stellaceae bacterium]
MATIKTGALVSALLLAAAPAAFAATHAAPAQTPPKAITGTVQPSQMLASKMLGMDVFGKYNQRIGSVQDIVLNRNGTVAAVVVKANNQKRIALPLKDFNVGHNWLALTNITGLQLNGMTPYHLELSTRSGLGVPLGSGHNAGHTANAGSSGHSAGNAAHTGGSGHNAGNTANAGK